MTETLVAGQFTNLKGSIRLNQINSFDLQLIDLTDTQLLTVGYNKPINIVINGRTMFVGKITRFEKQENVPIWDVHAEGAACILRDTAWTSELTCQASLISDIVTAILPSGWVLYCDSIAAVKKATYRVTPVRILSAISDLCQIGALDWYVDQDLSGNNRLNLVDSLVPSLPGKTYTTNTDAVYVNRKNNVDVLVTSAICTGVQPELSRTSTSCTAETNTIRWGAWGLDETKLSNNLSEATTIANVYSTVGYPSSGSLLFAGATQTISYSGKTATTFTGLKTASNATRTANNSKFTKAYTDVLAYGADIPIFTIPATTPSVDSTGTMRVGGETIGYSFLSSPAMTFSITSRGSNGYSHGKNTPIQFLDNTDGSQATLNGIRRKQVTCNGAITTDTMDMVCSNIVLKYAKTLEYGSLTALETDFWQDLPLGSELNIVPANKEGVAQPAFTSRLIGMDYDQFKPMVVYYGVAEDYVAADIGSIPTVKEIASDKAEYTNQATVLSTSNAFDLSTKMVELMHQGTSTWVEVI